ncbi:hypothetical protein NLN82_26895, partial [Citrobacter portucalensis]
NKEGELETVRAVIANTESIRNDESFRQKMCHLINKGVVFSLNDENERFFIPAFNTARENFTKLPYAYGLGYNCNTFVFSVLREMLNLKIKTRHADNCWLYFFRRAWNAYQSLMKGVCDDCD